MSDTASSAATVTVNGRLLQVDGETSVAALLEQLGHGSAGVAVAVNREVVSRSRWAAALLRDGDRVEIVAATQGG
jgi:sulfur carrier protein